MDHQFFHLDEYQVKQLLKTQELIYVMEEAMVDFSQKKILQPVRTFIPIPQFNGFFGLMPSVSTGKKVSGVKILSMYPNNEENFQLPSISALVLLFSATNGTPLCSMAAEYITGIRTAVVSAVATKFLSRKDSQSLAIIGTGVQAKTHIESLRFVRNFTQIRVWGRNYHKVVKFVDEMSKKYSSEDDFSHGYKISFVPCQTIQETLIVEKNETTTTYVDVITTVTNATEPILFGKYLSERNPKKPIHINAVGAPRHDWREIDDEIMKNSLVFVDSIEGAQNEAGDVILSKCEIQKEIGEVIKETKDREKGEEETYWNNDEHQNTIYKSLGMAVQDV